MAAQANRPAAASARRAAATVRGTLEIELGGEIVELGIDPRALPARNHLCGASAAYRLGISSGGVTGCCHLNLGSGRERPQPTSLREGGGL